MDWDKWAKEYAERVITDPMDTQGRFLAITHALAGAREMAKVAADRAVDLVHERALSGRRQSTVELHNYILAAAPKDTP
jgi:hypothetical protein